jgi:hypothetical protein
VLFAICRRLAALEPTVARFFRPWVAPRSPIRAGRGRQFNRRRRERLREKTPLSWIRVPAAGGLIRQGLDLPALLQSVSPRTPDIVLSLHYVGRVLTSRGTAAETRRGPRGPSSHGWRMDSGSWRGRSCALNGRS